MTQEKRDYAKIFAMLSACAIVVGQVSGWASHYLMDHETESRTREWAIASHVYLDSVLPLRRIASERRADSTEWRLRRVEHNIETLFKYKNQYYVQRDR